MSRRWFRALAGLAGLAGLVALVGCDPDGGSAPDAGMCVRPSLDAPWLPSLLDEALDRLAHMPRATPAERAAALAQLEALVAELGWTPERHDYPGGANLFATIPATAGDLPQIVVGAHYDTVAGSPGANDNATGAAVVLAVARFLADAPCRTAPVTVVWFDQEEIGLVGARAFAATLSPSSVRAVHTIDQVGWNADGDAMFELELPTAALEAEWRAAATATGAMLRTTSTGGTDHVAFRELGFAAVGLTEEFVGGDTSPYYHGPGDTPETVDLDYLALAARLTAQVVLAEVAP
ncbi:MAG: M28 family metallopeptidase [Kofleriaceae bacterium]